MYATSVGANANTVGVAAGYFLPYLFVKEDDINNPENAKDHVFWLLVSVSIVSTILMFLVIFTFTDKAPTPTTIC